MRIGVTGTFSGGKDLVGSYLESLGYHHVSTGDLVREEATRRGIPWSRENLQELANTLREENGAGYLARLALTKFADNVAVSGLRNMGEVRVLREDAPTRFALISVDAPEEKRYEWARQRGKLTDDVSLEMFARQQAYEMGHSHFGLQLGEVMAAAHVRIWNDGSKEELYRQVDTALKRFRQ